MLPFICSAVNVCRRVDAIIMQCMCSVKRYCAVRMQCNRRLVRVWELRYSVGVL